MGKESSTTGGKQRPPEARDVERMEGITKRDSDSEGGSLVGTNNNVMPDDTTINAVDMKESSTAIVSVPGSTTAYEVARNGKNSSNSTKETLDSEEEKQEVTEITKEGLTLSMSLIENEGPTSPSAIEEQSAEPSQEDEELRRRCQEVVTGTVVVENRVSVFEPFGRKERKFLIGAVFALLLVVGVVLGVVIPLTINNNNNKDIPSIDSTVTPTQSPIPSPAPTACLECLRLAEILLQMEVSDAEAFQDDSSPQFRALRWLANNDPMVLELNITSTVNLVEQYILAVLYFATSTEGRLNAFESVCEWRDVVCNGDDLVVALILGKSKHEEVIILISKFHFDSPISLPFYLNRF
jgi:hypothetical protein